MAQPRTLAHLQVEALLGFGGLGEVWRARDAQGQPVALRRTSVLDPVALRELRRLAGLVRGLPTPHLVRLRRVLADGDDRVLVLDLADGGPLAGLLAARGRLRPGEVVTAVAPVAAALQDAHAAGLAHGRISLASVLLTAEGMPVLEGLGLEPLRPAPERLDPADPRLAARDVQALAGLCAHLLTGRPADAVPAGPLAAAVRAGLADDPCSAGELSAALLAACPAEPLEGLVPVMSQTRTERSRWLLTVVAAAAVLAAVVAVGWTWGAHQPAAARVAPAASAARGQDWRGVLDALDARRAQAFARAEPGLMSQVWLAGSAADSQDRASVDRLRSDRRTAVGVRHVVTAAQVLVVGPDRVELSVVQHLGAQQVLRDGRVLERRPAGRPARCTVVLVRAAGGWRVAEVRPL